MNYAVMKLVRCLQLYPHYKVESRGPYGLILDAIQELEPDIAAKLKEGQLYEVVEEVNRIEDEWLNNEESW